MVSANVKVTNPMGLHMRPAQLFVREMTPLQVRLRSCIRTESSMRKAL